VEFVLLTYVALDDGAIALMEISQYLKQLFVGFIDSSNEVGKLVLFEIFAESSETMLHEFVDFDGIVVFMRPVYSEADGADEPSVLAVGVNADKGGVLAMGVAVVGLDEILEAFRELLHLGLY